MTDLKLKGRIALVTGAGGGIGRAICEAFAAEGASVICSDVDGSSVRETARLLGPAGMAVECDVRSAEAAKAAVAAIESVSGRANG